MTIEITDKTTPADLDGRTITRSEMVALPSKLYRRLRTEGRFVRNNADGPSFIRDDYVYFWFGRRG